LGKKCVLWAGKYGVTTDLSIKLCGNKKNNKYLYIQLRFYFVIEQNPPKTTQFNKFSNLTC